MSEIDTINENSYLSFVRQTYVQYAFIIINYRYCMDET